jgi:hypothetical protein
VPAAVAVAGSGAFVSDGPFQTIVFPGEFPVRVTVVVVHVNDPLAVPLTVGGVLFSITITEEVFVHPAGLVAVQVYVPGDVTVAGLAALLNDPPFQTIVFPADVPVSVTDVFVQVSVPDVTVVTAGVGLTVMYVVCVMVLEPLAFVAVSVTGYVPAVG